MVLESKVKIVGNGQQRTIATHSNKKVDTSQLSIHYNFPTDTCRYKSRGYLVKTIVIMTRMSLLLKDLSKFYFSTRKYEKNAIINDEFHKYSVHAHFHFDTGRTKWKNLQQRSCPPR
jgi:hypothetical protein